MSGSSSSSTPSNLEKAKALLLRLITVDDYVSFVEADRFLEKVGLFERATPADVPEVAQVQDQDEAPMISIMSEIDTNLILWQTRNMLLVKAFKELYESHQIHSHPSSPLIYALDGKQLAMPVIDMMKARKLLKRTGSLEQQYWFPVLLSIRPYKDEIEQSRKLRQSKG
jgi:hypothetical protein